MSVNPLAPGGLSIVWQIPIKTLMVVSVEIEEKNLKIYTEPQNLTSQSNTGKENDVGGMAPHNLKPIRKLSNKTV